MHAWLWDMARPRRTRDRSWILGDATGTRAREGRPRASTYGCSGSLRTGFPSVLACARFHPSPSLPRCNEHARFERPSSTTVRVSVWWASSHPSNRTQPSLPILPDQRPARPLNPWLHRSLPKANHEEFTVNFGEPDRSEGASRIPPSRTRG